jgi:uncharacterized RDD family membrane protein YckC
MTMTSLPETPGIARRLLSMLYESLLLFGVIVAGFLPPYFLLGVLAQILTPHWLKWIHFILLLMLYYVWFWLHGGQTLALKTWKMKITDRSGGPLRPTQAVLRYLAAWPSLLCGGIGIFWALFDRDRQFLHDRIADTRIILLPPCPSAPQSPPKADQSVFE